MKDAGLTDTGLLALYDRVAEAEDAIPRLRRFVLDLAVRGKLVPQEAGDEPAHVLLGRIGKVTQKPTKPQTTDFPFPLPTGWAWSDIGGICSKTGSGSTPRGGKEVYVPDGIAFLRSQNVYDHGLVMNDVAYISPEVHERMSGTRVQPADLLLNITGGSMGRCCRVPDAFSEANVSQHVAIIRCAFPEMADFLHALVRSPYFQGFIFGEQTGAGRGGLPKNRMDRIVVALPPLAEQHRIVAKVEALMALLDRLEAARTAREGTRTRLTAATLSRLTEAEADTPTAARFALQTLPALTTREDQIKTLRQTILNLAVRGKLVEQDTGDEGPALGNRYPSCPSPFTVPGNWRWVKLRELGTLKGGGTPSKSRPDFWDGTIPWVSPKDMKVAEINDAQMHVTEAALEESAVNLIPPQSVVFVVRGMILAHSFPVAINAVQVTINQDMKALVLKDARYAAYILCALMGLKPEMLRRVQTSSHGTCRIEGSHYSEFPLPLPPLAEQHRIVAKIEELMSLCDRLEIALREAATTRARLLDATLREALSDKEPA